MVTHALTSLSSSVEESRAAKLAASAASQKLSTFPDTALALKDGNIETPLRDRRLGVNRGWELCNLFSFRHARKHEKAASSKGPSLNSYFPAAGHGPNHPFSHKKIRVPPEVHHYTFLHPNDLNPKHLNLKHLNLYI